MVADLIFLNEKDEVLIVKPNYRDGWILAGGTVNQNESPRSACIRETKEELGLDVNPVRLLCVDYYALEPDESEYLYFIFYGGVLRDDEIIAIKLQSEELVEYRFVKPGEAKALLTKKFIKRLPHALHAIETGKTIYLEQSELV